MMELLALKDRSEGRMTGTRTTWDEDTKNRKSLKERAIALILDFEKNRDLLDKKVNSTFIDIKLLYYLLLDCWGDPKGTRR